MKRMIVFVALLILSVSGLVEARGIEVIPLSPKGEEVKGNQWLFVIGIDTYIHWPRLKTAVNDARAVKEVLLSRYYFGPEHVIELYDAEATRKSIIGKLRDLAENVKEHDSLLIFYAGHGHLDSITKDGSWIPVESETKDASAWISNHDIKNYLKVDAIKAKHILLVSDSCFAGDFFRGYRGDDLPKVDDAVIKRAYEYSSRQAITSGGLEPVSDEGFGGNSVFTHFFVKSLKENDKPFLIASEFFPKIRAGVAENSDQYPRFGSLKDTGGQEGGELVLFLKKDARRQGLIEDLEKRREDLERLGQMETDAKAAEKKEAEEIAVYERQISQLDNEIKAMKDRLGTAGKRVDDSLETLLAMVRDKEEQEERLKDLERKRAEEKARREAEIRKLQDEQANKRLAAFEEDVKTYSEIASSKYGKDLKETAWKSLIERYPDGKGLPVGDVDGLSLAFRGLGRLSVKTVPEDADVKILNVAPRFVQGMEIEPGQYEIEVSTTGYETKKIKVVVQKGKFATANVLLLPTVTARDGRFLRYGDGTVKDSKTGLVWAARDNGTDISWNNAKIYCITYQGGGYRDWRMPTQDELAGLYDSNAKKNHRFGLTKLIDITACCPWASETRGSEAAYLNFFYGRLWWRNQSTSGNTRALPVRAGN